MNKKLLRSLLFSGVALLFYFQEAEAQTGALQLQPPNGTPAPASTDGFRQQVVGAVGYTSTATVVPVIAAVLHATGVAVGPPQTIAGLNRTTSTPGSPAVNPATGPNTGPSTATVMSVVLTDTSLQNQPMDVVFFGAAGVLGTYADNVAVNLLADSANILGIIHITDWSVFAGAGVGQSLNPPLPVVPGPSIKFLVVSRGAFTATAVNNIRVRITTYMD